MSYSLFLLFFVGIPLVVLAVLGRARVTRRAAFALLALIGLSIIYTTPWDNYLVATRVWYYNPALVLNIVIGYVPIEEYTFFVLQTILTGLFSLWLWQRFYPSDWDRRKDSR